MNVEQLSLDLFRPPAGQFPALVGSAFTPAVGPSSLKRCPRCKTKKRLNEFTKNKSREDGLDDWCRKCHCSESKRFYYTNKIKVLKKQKEWRLKNPEKSKSKNKQWRLKNPENGKKWKIKNREKIRGYAKKRYYKNIEKCGEINKKSRQRNWKKVRERQKNWKHKNVERVRMYAREAQKKKRATLKGNLDAKISWQIWDSLKENKAGRHWETLVGYTVNDLRKHFEFLFTKDMNWNLFMQGKIHIDHKIPKSFFIYDKPEDQEFQYCWSLDNLQPLWAKDNLSKQARLI